MRAAGSELGEACGAQLHLTPWEDREAYHKAVCYADTHKPNFRAKKVLECGIEI